MNIQCPALGLELESFQRAATVTLLPYAHKPEHYLHPLLKHIHPFLSLSISPNIPTTLEHECSYFVWGCVRPRTDGSAVKPTKPRATVQADGSGH